MATQIFLSHGDFLTLFQNDNQTPKNKDVEKVEKASKKHNGKFQRSQDMIRNCSTLPQRTLMTEKGEEMGKIISQQKEILDLKQHMKIFVESNSSLQEQINSTMNKCQQIVQENEKYSIENSSMKHQKQDLEVKYKELQLLILKNNQENLKNNQQEIIQKFQNRIKELEQQVSDLKIKIELKASRNQDSAKEKHPSECNSVSQSRLKQQLEFNRSAIQYGRSQSPNQLQIKHVQANGLPSNTLKSKPQQVQNFQKHQHKPQIINQYMSSPLTRYPIQNLSFLSQTSSNFRGSFQSLKPFLA